MDWQSEADSRLARVRRGSSSVVVDLHVVRIGEDGGRAALLVNGVVQSISPADGLVNGGYWAAMVPQDARPRSALILGMGGGTIARLLQVRWGNVRIIGVDDDPTILDTARAVGWIPPSGMDVVVTDAFAFVQTCSERFDFVALDLFRADRLVGRAFGKPFLRRVRSLLAPHGTLAVNLFRDFREPERIARIEAFFDIRAQLAVGGNTVIHARPRRA
jgi:spermidine synthase